MGGYVNTPKIDKLKLNDAQHLIKMGEYYINLFCEEYKIDDVAKMSENRFKAALTYIYNHYYKLSLYTDKKRAPAINNVIDYTDIGQLDAILNAYIFLCNVCDKIPSVSGFALYTGIESDTLFRWVNEYEANDAYNTPQADNDGGVLAAMGVYNSINNSGKDKDAYIYNSSEYINTINSIKDKTVYRRVLVEFRYKLIKRLYSSKEEALADRLSTAGGGSPVGIIAVLNHQFDWANNAPNITVNQPQISISDLPKLTDGNGNV